LYALVRFTVWADTPPDICPCDKMNKEQNRQWDGNKRTRKEREGGGGEKGVAPKTSDDAFGKHSTKSQESEHGAAGTLKFICLS
jgi:hypothetical protein